MKFAEKQKEGFYYKKTQYSHRCYYLTGTLKGNKWIDLEVPNPEWMSLIWTCIDKECVDNTTFYDTNPTPFNIKLNKSK